MVKKKGPVWNFYNSKGKGVSCKYCFKEYKVPHAKKMETHIQKCFKCPQGLKKVFELGRGILIENPKNPVKNIYEPLAPLVIPVRDLDKPGPSSASEISTFKSSSSSSSDITLQLQLPASSTPKGIPSFVDHMDVQTNVSKHLRKQIIIIRPTRKDSSRPSNNYLLRFLR